MYIVAEGPEGLYLIDQHAAHERVLYEKMMAGIQEGDVPRQALMEPLSLELSPRQLAALDTHQEMLKEAGFELEPFGPSTWLLRSVPTSLQKGDPTRMLKDILDELVEGERVLEESREGRITAAICKQIAIKGGQELSTPEARALIEQLEQAATPRTCPHGRPTMIHISASLLARQFGRGG
jgi:DNA mismatch repair protein MutL